MTIQGAEYKVGDEVYFYTDPEGEGYLITGVLDRGDCLRYLISDKYSEREVAGFQITKVKPI